MKRWTLPVCLALCLLLSGCASLLQRSYSVVEPYSDRYWDSSAEDTLRAESYQDLVNSLLMLIEQRTEEGVIRCYKEANSYQQAQAAREEVRRETTLGSYLLRTLTFSYENGPSYSTLTYQMTYREDAADIESILKLSDSQSLVDLLRLALREEHERLTAQFVSSIPRAEVLSAVEGLWQDLCNGELEAADAPEDVLEGEPVPEDGTAPEDSPETADGAAGGEISPDDGPEPESVPEAPQEQPPEQDPDAGAVEPVSGTPEPAEEPVTYPPCPWVVRFYPDKEMASIVEIMLAAA